VYEQANGLIKKFLRRKIIQRHVFLS